MLNNKLYALAAFIILSFSVSASHLVGGEIYYDTVGMDGNGNMEYRIYFELFRDCDGIDFPGENGQAPFHYTIFYPNGDDTTQVIPFTAASELPLVYDDPCVDPPDDVCIESTIYATTIKLPLTANDYTISYQVGNWAGSYVNFLNPASLGMTLTTTIPGTNTVAVPNNSPRFEDYPQIVFCLDNELTIPSNMIEEDGDSLAFSLCNPLEYVNNGGGLNPNPEEAPPYNSIPWETGFNANEPFGNGSPTNIDGVTGDFTVTPDMIGNFVARVCVEEWRDGSLISTHSRTFGYTIVECDVEVPFEISVLGGGEITEGCGGIEFLIERNDTVGDLELYSGSSGDAEMGFNYENMPDTIIIPEGVENDTINVNTIFQPEEEGDLDGTVFLTYENICTGELDTVSTNFTIIDYIEMQLTVEDSINLCAEKGTVYPLTPDSFSGGVGPYYYEWTSDVTTYPNNDTAFIDATTLNDNLNMHYLKVYDQCGFEIDGGAIEIYEQCRVVVPNIITPNNDNVNDLFVIRNNGDYDRIKVQIYNRWGNLIFESNDYQDNWDGTHRNGKPVTEGVYFYTVTPMGDKYIYREDDEENPYLMHGYVHVKRGKGK